MNTAVNRRTAPLRDLSHEMRLAVSTLLSAGAAFQPAHVSQRVLPRCGTRPLAIRSVLSMHMNGTNEAAPDHVKVTIRKRSGEAEAGKPATEADDGVAFPAFSGQASPEIFAARFSHVKKSLATFFKFWLMGGCGVEGWSGVGELEAQHTSGTKASIQVDVEDSIVSLTSQSAPSADGNAQLNDFAVAVLDELETLAKTGEAAERDRLCYPPEAVGPARLAAWASLAPRETTYAVTGVQPSTAAETEFERFLNSLK
jgi:hypothetical protein